MALRTNSEALANQFLSFSGGHFNAMTGGKVNSTELAAAMLNYQKSTFAGGIRFAQNMIEGTCSMLILKEDGHLIAARTNWAGCLLPRWQRPGRLLRVL